MAFMRFPYRMALDSFRLLSRVTGRKGCKSNESLFFLKHMASTLPYFGVESDTGYHIVC